MKIKICGSKTLQDDDQNSKDNIKKTLTKNYWKINKFICWTLIAIILLFIISFTCLVINAYLLTTEGFKRIKLDQDPTYLSLPKYNRIEQAKRLLEGIKIDTTSATDGEERDKYLNGIKKIHEFIERSYPNIHQAEYIKKIVVNDYSLIYRVQGTSPSKRVYMLSSHLDTIVVKWYSHWHYYYDPYLGKSIKEYCDDVCPAEENVDNIDYIHGKGAMSTKNLVFGILEALEHLVRKKTRPSRTFYIAFSHDSKLDGLQGAGRIKDKMFEILRDNQEFIDFVLDPGTSVHEDAFPSVNDPLIYISVTERAEALLRLDMSSREWNSVAKNISIKQERCSRSKLLRNSLTKIENSEQPFLYGDGPEYDTWIYGSAFVNRFGYKLLSSHPWILAKLISMGWVDPIQFRILLLRTKTYIQSTPKAINDTNEIFGTLFHYIHPADDINSIISRHKKLLNDDRIEMYLVPNGINFPATIANYSSDSIAFQVIANSALDVFRTGKIIPGPLGGPGYDWRRFSDGGRYYWNLTNNIYRFSPMLMKREEYNPGGQSMYDGYYEKISVDNYNNVVEFYHRLIKNADLALNF